MAESNVIRAFSVDHVVKLTGLSKRQLSYWDKTEFFKPHYAAELQGSPFSRIYSFKDVVGLRVLATLRNRYGCPLQHLRKVAQELTQYSDTPWSDITLYVLGKRVQFQEPETEKIRGVVDKQYVSIRLKSIIHEVEQEAKKLTERSRDKIGRIERKRHTAHNAWVVAGTRIPTKAIQRFKDAGFTINQIIKEYPLLTKKDIEAALAHEQRLAKSA